MQSRLGLHGKFRVQVSLLDQGDSRFPRRRRVAIGDRVEDRAVRRHRITELPECPIFEERRPAHRGGNARGEVVEQFVARRLEDDRVKLLIGSLPSAVGSPCSAIFSRAMPHSRQLLGRSRGGGQLRRGGSTINRIETGSARIPRRHALEHPARSSGSSSCHSFDRGLAFRLLPLSTSPFAASVRIDSRIRPRDHLDCAAISVSLAATRSHGAAFARSRWTCPLPGNRHVGRDLAGA